MSPPHVPLASCASTVEGVPRTLKVLVGTREMVCFDRSEVSTQGGGSTMYRVEAFSAIVPIT